MDTKYRFAGLALLLIAGCSSAPQPIIDTKGVDMTVYQQDLAECQQYALQVDTSSGVTKGAAVGAAVGGALGAVSGGSGKRGAASGAIVGATKSGGRAANEKQAVVKNCLRGRGYRVLN
ncbi:MAG: glycine zipper family protein [Gammaproteobacteria bacterium]|jgi:hypothetical protein|nr:glycine zipper family protein [Gammaproteobacteria bacterium]MDP6616222.1 glycine zipper family protein [Gammaproteobacteria bacterium]MDP6695570.1 glycine zipper family protein [Gammaproteobacteria bacterium]